MTAAEITHDLYRRLRNRYGRGDGHVLLCNVGNGAGHGNDGYADAIAMQTWPSKGLSIIGFEVKASRSDWLKELDSPEKNKEWQFTCHQWYIVAAKGIVKLEELPPSWGLMVPSGKDKLRISSRCEAPKDDRDLVPLSLMAAVFRAAGKETHDARSQMRDQVIAGIRAQFKERLDSAIADASSARRSWLEEQAENRELRRILGPDSKIEEMKAKVKALNALRPEWLSAPLKNAAGRLDRIRQRLEAVAKEVDEACPKNETAS